ncbi:MAG: conjugal transfer protein TraG, partial [Bacteroidales bacterium]|nr:conjugal transfer protein TraG [Bacteroidales bacterium]
MVLYVILFFAAVLIGMAVSVAAFGTGGKRSRIFRDIYFTVEEVEGIGVLYTKNGDYSAVLRMENPVQKYSANIDAYYEFTSLFTSLAQTLGEGYAMHKQDIFCRRRFRDEENGRREFLSDSYFRYFAGREYTDALTYLVITQESRGGRFFSYDA